MIVRAALDDLSSFLSTRGLSFHNSASFKRAAERAQSKLPSRKVVVSGKRSKTKVDTWSPATDSEAAVMYASYVIAMLGHLALPGHFKLRFRGLRQSVLAALSLKPLLPRFPSGQNFCALFRSRRGWMFQDGQPAVSVIYSHRRPSASAIGSLQGLRTKWARTVTWVHPYASGFYIESAFSSGRGAEPQGAADGPTPNYRSCVDAALSLQEVRVECRPIRFPHSRATWAPLSLSCSCCRYSSCTCRCPPLKVSFGAFRRGRGSRRHFTCSQFFAPRTSFPGVANTPRHLGMPRACGNLP